MRWIWPTSGLLALAVVLGSRRALSDRRAARLEAHLLRASDTLPTFSETDLAGLPEPAIRYLRHAIAPGTPLSPACRIEMTGTMTPSPGSPPTALTAVEALTPREGFVWTAQATMKGLPVRVRDQYHRGVGGVYVTAAGVLPIPLGGNDADVARSARGRLAGEAVWCPTALLHPDVTWDDVDADRARYTLSIDGAAIAVTLHIDREGALKDVTLNRWGAPEGGAARLHPYGFRVDAEGTFDGVTIPTRITGGWDYGTEAYNETRAATFTVHHAEFAALQL